jgi:hypothetical protein
MFHEFILSGVLSCSKICESVRVSKLLLETTICLSFPERMESKGSVAISFKESIVKNI